MEFLPFSFEILLAGALFLILLVKILKKREINGPAVHLPPGPSKLPIIGSMHHLIGPLPHHTLRDLAKKYGDLMHLQLGEVSALVVSSTDFSREVLVTNQANFASRPLVLAADIMTYNCTDIAFAPYGEYWRQVKKLCTLELLSAKRVKSFWPIRKELTKLMNTIASMEGSPVNLSREVDSSIHAITAVAAFGKKCQEHQQFIHIAKEFARTAGGFNIADVYPSARWLHYVTGFRTKLMKLHRQGDMIMQKLIDQHKMKKASEEDKDDDAGAEDLVDVLLRYQHPNEDNFSFVAGFGCLHIAKEFSRTIRGFNIAVMYPSARWLHYVTGFRTKLMKLHRQGDRIKEKMIDRRKMKKASVEGKNDEAEEEALVHVLLNYQRPNEDHFFLTMDNIKATILARGILSHKLSTIFGCFCT